MKNRSRKLTVIIGAALIAAPIVSAAQNTAGNISNYELLQQIRNLQQEIAELRDRIDRQEYLSQQNSRANNQANNSNSNNQQALPSTTFPSQPQVNSQNNAPSYSQQNLPQGNQLPDAGTYQPSVQPSGGSQVVGQNGAGYGLPTTPTPAAPIPQGVPVDSVNTGLRVEDRVNSPQQQSVSTGQTGQPRPSSSVANPQADLLERGDKAIRTSLQEEDLYAKGLDKLKQQQYEEAVSLFNSQLQTYPRGQRSADAYYWVGESLYILENLDSSKKSYQSILTLFPSSRRVPNALFKVAKIENEQGNQSSAKATLESLLARYPKSSAAAQARVALADLL